MGQLLSTWQVKVLDILRDDGKDFSADEITRVGIQPALARYSVDRPRRATVEVAGAGSAFFDMPAGWSSGFSQLEAVEYPARQDVPVYLDTKSWKIVRKRTDVTVEQILLSNSPGASEYVRFTFTAPWPMPSGADVTVDKVDAVAFEAVCALAAANCLTAMAGEAARRWSTTLPVSGAIGEDQTRMLIDMSRRYYAMYLAFLGLNEAGRTSVAIPASRTFDFDPSAESMFHGSRR